MPVRGVIAATLILVASSAQLNPDFSGERRLNLEASALSPAMSRVQSGKLRIEHDEPSVRVHLTLVVDDKPFETVVERTTDGREVSSVRQGRQTISTAKWDGDVLVFTSRSQGPDCEGILSVRYELLDGGRRIKATERIRGCGRDEDNVWVFDRP